MLAKLGWQLLYEALLLALGLSGWAVVTEELGVLIDHLFKGLEEFNVGNFEFLKRQHFDFALVQLALKVASPRIELLVQLVEGFLQL